MVRLRETSVYNHYLAVGFYRALTLLYVNWHVTVYYVTVLTLNPEGIKYGICHFLGCCLVATQLEEVTFLLLMGFLLG